MANISEVTIQNLEQTKHIAKIGLNGYKRFTQNPTRRSGTSRLIWSFTILDGDRKELKSSWANNRPVTLKTPNGHAVSVRVAAYPSTKNGFGLIEFL